MFLKCALMILMSCLLAASAHGTDRFSLAIGPDGKIFLVAKDGVYRSLDEGITWNLIGLEKYAIEHLAVDSKGNLYAANGGGGKVYCSKDVGQTWVELYACPGWITALAVAPSDSVMIGTWNGGLFEVAGTTGKLMLAKANTNDIVFHPNGSIFSGDGYGGINRFHDDKWSKVTPKTTVFTMAVAKATGSVFAGPGADGVYRSTDEGETWAIVNKGLSGRDVNTLAVDQVRKIVYAGSDAVYRSTDDGLNWTRHELPQSSHSVAVLAIHPANHWVYARAESNEGAVFRSKDDGATWRQVWPHLTEEPAAAEDVDARVRKKDAVKPAKRAVTDVASGKSPDPDLSTQPGKVISAAALDGKGLESIGAVRLGKLGIIEEGRGKSGWQNMDTYGTYVDRESGIRRELKLIGISFWVNYGGRNWWDFTVRDVRTVDGDMPVKFEARVEKGSNGNGNLVLSINDQYRLVPKVESLGSITFQESNEKNSNPDQVAKFTGSMALLALTAVLLIMALLLGVGLWVMVVLRRKRSSSKAGKAGGFKFACVHCGQHLASTAEMLGMEVNCPSCGKLIQVTPSAPASSPPPLPVSGIGDSTQHRKSEEEETMVCESCGRRLPRSAFMTVSVHSAKGSSGRTLQCTDCGINRIFGH